MNLVTLTAACCLLPAQAPGANFDFRAGLAGWHGRGMYVTTADPRGPSLRLGMCSSDCNAPVGTAERRFTFVVPSGVDFLSCEAWASFAAGRPPGNLLDIYLISTSGEHLRKDMEGISGWLRAGTLLPRTDGKAGRYRWPITGLVGKTVQLVVSDRDARPGCHLFCSGFRLDTADQLTASGGSDLHIFAAEMRKLERDKKVPPLVRFESKNFTAWSNASDEFTEQRMRNCELMYGLFYKHFRDRGFAIRPPATRLMIAVLDSQEGFEAYLGRKMPGSVTGVYNRLNNRLVIYDLQQNSILVDSRKKAIEDSRKIRLDLDRIRYIQTVNRVVHMVGLDASVSTAMHETAHQLSFNCGMLNRNGDVPLWLGEGLACYCEPTDTGGWQGIGEPNPSRIATLAAVRQKRGRYISLRTLVQTDDWRNNTPQALLGYAQSWALFRMLMEEQPGPMRSYLNAIFQREAPDHRIADFGQAFGANVDELDRQYQVYLDRLVQQHPPQKIR